MRQKTYMAYWIGGSECWELFDRTDASAIHKVNTEELQPVSYELQRREYGTIVETWKTTDGADLRRHLMKLATLVDGHTMNLMDKDLLYLAIFCWLHDLDLMVRTYY